MKILVDADACPVKEEILKVAGKYRVPVLMVTDNTHMLHYPQAEIITVDKHRDSADFALLNRLAEGDMVITQDYGLASLALAKKAVALNNFAQEYTKDNIDRLLFERHLNQKARAAGQKTAHAKKRRAEDNALFMARFEEALQGLLH